MNVIDVGCSYTKSYLLAGNQVVNAHKMPVTTDRVFKDTLTCFEHAGKNHSQHTIVLSTSDCVVWEDKNQNVRWLEHNTPDIWMNGLPLYKVSGHPGNEELRGAANQMLYLENEVGLDNIKRILPMSTYIATLIANNPTWNGWDYTHASNSGFYDYNKAGWSKAAERFIRAGVIDQHLYRSDTLIEGNSNRKVYLGGHDSVFSNATDFPYSAKPYISCGTWTTVSLEVRPTRAANIPEYSENRYVIAPNGSILNQRCFLSEPDKLKTAAARILKFLHKGFDHATSIPKIDVFGNWSGEMYNELKESSDFQFNWIEPNRFWGCIHLPQKAGQYVQRSKGYVDDTPYFCEGA